MKIKPLTNEEIIATSLDDDFVLTNFRVQIGKDGWMSSSYMCIFLENISSIETRYKSKPYLLWLALLSVPITGYIVKNFSQTPDFTQPLKLFIPAVIILFIWFVTRESAIRISSNGGSSLELVTSGISKDKVYNSINAINEAKRKRTAALFKLQ
jgi:hypothetical protein